MHAIGTPKKRRRYQISLRTLILLVTLACIAFATLGIKTRRVIEQREAVAAIQKLGGNIYFDYQFDSSGVWLRDATPPGPAWLRKLLGDDVFASVASVTTYGDDESLVHLRKLPNVVYLDILGPTVTDTGLIHIQDMVHVEVLNLIRTRISDTGLGNLRRMGRLRRLSLRATRVNGSGLGQLVGLSKLTHLDLGATPIDDVGIRSLYGMAQLEELSLAGTQVTKNGVTELRAALPKLDVRVGKS